MLRIVWADAHANDTNAWVYLGDVKDTGEYLVESVGWLLAPGTGGQTGHVSIVQSIGADEAGDAILNIPVGMIRRVELLSGKRVSLADVQRWAKHRPESR